MNTNLILIGDAHLQTKAPISRIDDYKSSIEDKIRQICALARDNNADIIIPGDIFSKIQTDNEFIVWFLGLFKQMNENSTVYTIFGNHDYYRNQFDLEDKTPIKILEEAGLVKVLRKGSEVKIGNITLKGFGYYDELEPASNGNCMLIAHKFFQQSKYKEHNIQADKLDELGYKYALLGHDHISYSLYETKKGALVFRPGSLMRGTSHIYNFDRTVNVVLFDTLELRYASVPLKIKPMQDVVSETTIISKTELNDEKEFDEYLSKVNELVADNNVSDEIKTLITRVKNKSEYNDNVKNKIINKLMNIG